MRRRRIVLAGLAIAALAAVFGGHLITLASTGGVARGDDLPVLRPGEHRAALVFGAGLKPDGSPTRVLRDRVRAGVRLARAHRVDVLVMSGDSHRDGYSEPSAMRKLALEMGLPDQQLALDYAGRRTWDSCQRAHDVFGLRRAVLVSSDFHRARTILLCRAAGVQAVGATGTSSWPYGSHWKWRARELLASWRGLSDAWIHHPSDVVGGKPVDPYDHCAVVRSLNAPDRAVATDQARDC